MENLIIDIELAKMVFGDNDEMYKKYLFQLVDRNLLGQVEEYLDAGNVQSAFETAHTMKGLVQNLALTSFSIELSKLVEIMRPGTMPTAEERNATMEKYNELVNYLNTVKENNTVILK